MIMERGSSEVLSLQPRRDFVETPAVRDLTERALAYLGAGYPVHFRGVAGTGKTTLALHVAAQVGRPVVLMAGDEEFRTSDLVGGQHGYRYRKVVDRYIHTVLKYEEDTVERWVDHRLTTACREGLTLVYDEFTRSRAEANNILLGVLEEQLLVLPAMNQQDSYVRVHPEFRAIFTSNQEEYAGVHPAQDALADRLVTIDLDHYDRATEIAITTSGSGLTPEAAGRIVEVVRGFRDSEQFRQPPTLRACLMIARVTALQGFQPSAQDERFVRLCLDILESKVILSSRQREERMQEHELIRELVRQHCG